MPLTFPPNPAVGDEYVAYDNAWIWNSKGVWERGASPLVLTSLLPDTAFFAVDYDHVVQATGTGFRSGSGVTLDGVTIPAVYVSSTQFTTTINGVNEVAARDAMVRVGNSNALPFHFTGPTAPPSFQSINPTSAWNNWVTLDISCIGSGFHPAAKAIWNGVEQANTVYVSPNEIKFNINPSVEPLGLNTVGVTNGAGFTASNTETFSISY
jgi:hypothetical protein